MITKAEERCGRITRRLQAIGAEVAGGTHFDIKTQTRQNGVFVQLRNGKTHFIEGYSDNLDAWIAVAESAGVADD